MAAGQAGGLGFSGGDGFGDGFALEAGPGLLLLLLLPP
jgi:hypothetical protein